MRTPFAIALAVFLLAPLSAAPARASAPAAAGVKAGFVYVGPVGDYGWSHAHDVARKALDAKHDWLSTVFVESVAEADCARVVDRLVLEEKCDIVFTTSFGYMNDTARAAKRHPDRLFMHCSGFTRDRNLGTYFAELHQVYYLNGLMAGALSKTGKLGYVGAQPIPEVVRHINAFAIGARAVNPKAEVHVKWLYAWYDPAKAREAAEALIAQGCDALAFTEDSPAVVQAGEEHTAKGRPLFTFAHYSPMLAFGKASCVSGQLCDWTGMYEEILSRVRAGAWESRDLWWMLREGAAILGADAATPVNPLHEAALRAVAVDDPVHGRIPVLDLVMKRRDEMAEATVLFDPFTGPLKDNAGAERLKAGQRGSRDMLWSMDWFVEGVAGAVPK